jgi:hypothetical protein
MPDKGAITTGDALTGRTDTSSVAPVLSGGENIGVHQLRLVGGELTNLAAQEYFGLLSMQVPGAICSASLLRNDWAITAAHCVEVKDTSGRPFPDLTKPGQFVVIAPATVTLSAAWGGGQSLNGAEIVTFRPFDIALIRLAGRFSVFGDTTFYSRPLFQDGQFPYWGEDVPVLTLMFGRGINAFAQKIGNAFVMAQLDSQYRTGWAKTTRHDDHRYWFPSEGGQMIAGGDSGGPSYAWVLGGYALMGVHSMAKVQCLTGAPIAWQGQICGEWRGPGAPPTGYNPWAWVAATPESGDARIAPIAKQIEALIGPPPPAPSEEPQPPGFIGTFGPTPANLEPMWIYSVQDDGILLWHRKNSGEAPWQGPKAVGWGWGNFRDVIPAGGSGMYALTEEGRLLWYRHDGFNDGSFNWQGPVEVGHGWNFHKIFSGSDGIVYAIQEDGTLLWYRHGGFASGGGIDTWFGPRVVGSGWAGFRDVFSSGRGVIYAVQTDGELLRYQHDGFETGEPEWRSIGELQGRPIGTGWDMFRQIVPAGDGVIVGIKEDGILLRYKDLGPIHVAGTPFELEHWDEGWEGPVEIGTGWLSSRKVLALLPSAPPFVR